LHQDPLSPGAPATLLGSIFSSADADKVHRTLTTAAVVACLSAPILAAATQPVPFPTRRRPLLRRAGRAIHQRAPRRKFEYARARFVKYAFTPSKVWSDSAVWTSMHEDTASRTLLVKGRVENGVYLLDPVQRLPAADRRADTRHSIALRRLSDSEYQWNTNVDMAVGPVGAADFETLLERALLAASRGDERAIRSEYQTLLPLTRLPSAALPRSTRST